MVNLRLTIPRVLGDCGQTAPVLGFSSSALPFFGWEIRFPYRQNRKKESRYQLIWSTEKLEDLELKARHLKVWDSMRNFRIRASRWPMDEARRMAKAGGEKTSCPVCRLFICYLSIHAHICTVLLNTFFEPTYVYIYIYV